jgi:death-on-curing protein
VVNKLDPKFIEHIHDVLVSAFLPFDEKINPAEYRSHALIESAAARPFQTAFGSEVWPTLPQKAAALFHSLACNHCFINGNKRTAVIGLDLFLAINRHLLFMASDDVYEMAKATAKANQEGREIELVMADLATRISDSIVDADVFKNENVKVRLGANYEKIMLHVERMVDFSSKIIKLHTPPIQT